MTRRSDAGDRNLGSLGPDSAQFLSGHVSTVHEQKFARVFYLNIKRVGSLGPGFRRRSLNPVGEALIFNPRESRYLVGEMIFEFSSGIGVEL